MSVPGRQRVRNLLLGFLVFATAIGAIAFALQGGGRTIADVTVTGVARKSSPDRLWMDLTIRMRGKTTCSWVTYDDGAVTVSPAMEHATDDDSLIDWYFRPSGPAGGLGFSFELEPGEDFTVHVSPSRSLWLQSGQELLLVSSSHEGVRVRSVALRFEASEP